MENQPGNEIHKGNQFKKILVHGSWYLVSSVLTKVSQILLLPVYTRYIDPTEYGVLQSLYSILRFLPIVISFYLDSSFARYYYMDRVISREKVTELYSTHFWFVLGWGILMTLGLWIISPFTVQPLLKIPFLPFIPIISTVALLNQLVLMGTIQLKAELKAKKVILIEIVALLLNIGLTLYLLIFQKMGIKANLFGLLLASIASIIYFMRIASQNAFLKFVFKFSVLVRSLKFSIPLIPNIAAGWISNLSDRLILAFYGEMEQVGLYSLSAQIALMLYLINDAMTQVQGPIGMSAFTEDPKKAKVQMSEFISFYVWVMFFAYLGLTFFSKEVLYILTAPSYHSAYRLVAILAFMYVVSGLYRVFTVVLAYHEKTWVISSAAIVAAIVNLILNFSLIPIFGQWAAAWSSLFSMFSYTCWITYWAQKIDKIDIQFGVVAPAVFVGLVLLAIQQTIEYKFSIGFGSGILLKVGMMSIYVFTFLIIPSTRTPKKMILLKIKNKLKWS
ncbi:hypothetical protein BVX98_04370 [bacterium F11]|nr:hypothetical protein BVX98_04370 [bacterium F11]